MSVADESPGFPQSITPGAGDAVKTNAALEVQTEVFASPIVKTENAVASSQPAPTIHPESPVPATSPSPGVPATSPSPAVEASNGPEVETARGSSPLGAPP